MSRVVSSLITDHDVKLFGEQVDDFPFPLISPLSANHHNICHVSLQTWAFYNPILSTRRNQFFCSNVYRCLSMMRAIASRVVEPTICSLTMPFLNSRSVGIPLMLYLDAVEVFLSTSSL